MWIVAIAWMYVALLMALSEAVSPVGSVLGAIITLLFYGVLPTALVMYVLGTPQRRKARLAREVAEHAADPASTALTTPSPPSPPSSSPPSPPIDGDAGSLPPSDPIAPEGKEAR